MPFSYTLAVSVTLRYHFFCWQNDFLLVVVERVLLYINRPHELMQADVGFHSCTSPMAIPFHVVWVLGFLCSEELASLGRVRPPSRSSASAPLATSSLARETVVPHYLRAQQQGCEMTNPIIFSSLCL